MPGALLGSDQIADASQARRDSRAGAGAGAGPCAGNRAQPRPDLDPDKQPLGVIILSHAPPGGIRFSISKDLFKNAPNHATLPDRLLGEIDRWTNRKDPMSA